MPAENRNMIDRVLHVTGLYLACRYVKQEAKLVYLLKCLQKTPPPVPQFATAEELAYGWVVLAGLIRS